MKTAENAYVDNELDYFINSVEYLHADTIYGFFILWPYKTTVNKYTFWDNISNKFMFFKLVYFETL